MKKNYYYVYSFYGYELSDNALRVLTLLIYRKKKDSYRWSDYIPLCAKTLHRLFDKDYKIAIEELKEKGIITPYTVDGKELYSADLKLSKSYRISAEIAKLFARGQYEKIVFNSPKPRNRKKPGVNATRDDFIVRVIDFYEDIIVDDAWLNNYTQDQIDRCYGKYAEDFVTTKRINSGDIFVKYGNDNDSSRVFHPIICGRKELRPYILYKGSTIVDIDVTACHPWMMGVFCKTIEERDRWHDIVSNGLYERFVSDKVSRKQVKQKFQIALSKLKHEPSKLVKEIRELIHDNAPSVYALIADNSGDTLQKRLQRLEADIFINTAREVSKTRFVMPMHDGFLCLPEDADSIIGVLQERAKEVLGFELLVKIDDFKDQ